jgi:hypothetical protein
MLISKEAPGYDGTILIGESGIGICLKPEDNS